MEILLFSFSLVSIFCLIYYYKYYFTSLFKYRNDLNNNSTPISIIICIHGKEPNFQKYLPKIISQKYPEFEIIIVSKNLNDSDSFFIASQVLQYSFIKNISLDYGVFPYLGKKQALHQAISNSSYDTIVTIDADCYPENDYWLQNISNTFKKNTFIVIGYSPFIKQPSWMNKWIRYDSSQVALMYLSMASLNKAYMAVGRNMAFKKNLWTHEYLEKFKSFAHGDDDSLIQFYHNLKIDICLNTKVYTYSNKTIFQWLIQKTRHTSTGKFYQKSTLYTLAFYPLMSFVFYLSIWIWLSFFKTHYLIFLLIILYWFLKMILIYKFEKKVSLKNKTWYYLPLFDFIYSFSLLILPIITLFYKPKWK